MRLVHNLTLGAITAILLAGCARPTNDAATLAAIKSEAQELMEADPNGREMPVPQDEWPRTIATLQPAFVNVDQQGVDIIVKPYFDGGYGYYVLKAGHQLPAPTERYEKLDAGLYWYRPY